MWKDQRTEPDFCYHRINTPPGETTMPDYSALSLAELDNRIAVVRDNIRQLIEQAAAASGERNEERISDRLAQQNDELEALSKARDALTGKP
jgi:hypothetical protein